MKKMTILFDLDGTLIDSTSAILESFNLAFTKLGFNGCDDKKLKSLIGYTLEDIFIGLGLERELIADGINHYKTHYRKISLEQTTLLPYAKEAVELAYSFANIGIVTTKISLYIDPLMQSLNIHKYFQKGINIVGFNDVKNPKPHPEPMLTAMNMLDSNKQSTWMIGDTRLDTKSASSANIRSVGVLCGYGEENDMKKDTKFICKNAKEAVQLIHKVMNSEI